LHYDVFFTKIGIVRALKPYSKFVSKQFFLLLVKIVNLKQKNKT